MPRPLRTALVPLVLAALAVPAPLVAQSRPKPAAAKPAPAKPAPRAWVRVVTKGADGAYSLGNPAARVKVREYISYTCGACARLSTTADAPFKTGYVAKGLVQIEMRNAVRDILDFTAAVAARCGPANQFWDRHMALLSTQKVWLDRASKLPEETSAKWKDAAPGDLIVRIASDVGLFAPLARFGVTPARLKACGNTPAEIATVEALSNASWQTDKIDHTPTIAINGTIAPDIHDWPALKTALDQRLAAR